jgi:DNA-directed RNA polymerase beta subunit
LLGKIARKSGKSIKLQDFSDISDLNDWVMKECKKYNIKAMETITDPENNRQIPNILTGDRFFMKLSHMSDDKLAGRATGGYTMNETPAKGGPEGSKALSLLDVNALLSHGATSVIRDAGLVRGQKNDDMWAVDHAWSLHAEAECPVRLSTVHQQPASCRRQRAGRRAAYAHHGHDRQGRQQALR